MNRTSPTIAALCCMIVLSTAVAGTPAAAGAGRRPAALQGAEEALKRLKGEVGGTLQLRWNAGTGAPQWVAAVGGALTGPNAGRPAEAARSWLLEHRGLFGLSPDEIAALDVARDHRMPGGMHVVWLQQTWAGLPAAHGGLATFAFDREGRLVSVGADLVPGVTLTAPRQLSAQDALSLVARRVFGIKDFVASALGSKAGYQVFEPSGAFAPHYVRPAAFPTSVSVRPVWEVLFQDDMTRASRVLVDAETGDVLKAFDLVDHFKEEGLVFDNYPGAPAGGSQVIRSFEGDPEASPQGWVGLTGLEIDDVLGMDLGLGQADALTTLGNNANTFANWSNFIAPADQVVRPVAPFGRFHYGFADSWNRSNCRAVTPAYAEDTDAAVVNLFYHHNVMHDFFYRLGFTEAAGNLQLVNFSGEGLGEDALIGLAQAGAVTGGAPLYLGRDNAYMLTLPDGLPSWSGMFLWEPINDSFEGPCRDGDFDATVIYHEFTHAVSTRMVPQLSGFQSGSMGEAWGDFFALDYLIGNGFEDDTVVGEYATGDPETGIRNWTLADTPVTYGDLGYDITGPEVHADGEIWAGILWRLREALVEARGETEGVERARQIIVSAMPISAPSPSMIDMRDAILAADQATFNGEDEVLLWEVFAEVGLGASARSEGTADSNPQPAFDHVDGAANGTVSGRLRNATTGSPIAGARVIVGDYEARVSPVVVTGEDGTFSFPAVAGDYTVTVQAPGYGAQALPVDVSAGKTTKLKLHVDPNLASAANGATVEASSEGAAPATALIDDTEATAWNSGDLGTPVNEAEAKPSAVVTLAGDQKAKIRSLRVSAYENTGTGRFVAARDYVVEISDGGPFTEVARGTFDAQPPRPKAPALHYQTITLRKPVSASQVKVTILSVQGETAAQSELAELQVFGKGAGKVEPVTVEKPDPFVSDEATILGTNPTSDLLGGITQTEFAATCSYPPATQGLDGWVWEIPEELGRGNATVVAKGSGSPIGHDLDLYFYSEGCSSLGSAASSATDESGAVPFGTRYIVVDQWLGLNTTQHIEVTPT